MNILRIQFLRIASKRLLYNTTSESCVEGNILRIQFRRIASKRKCWNTTSESYPKRMPGENAILQNCLKENVVGCNIRKVLQEECFYDIDSGSQFWSWIFNLGSDLIFDSGRFFFNLDDDSGSVLIFDSRLNFDSLNDDSGSRFIYVWLSVDKSRSRISSSSSSSFFFFFCTIWG